MVGRGRWGNGARMEYVDCTGSAANCLHDNAFRKFNLNMRNLNQHRRSDATKTP